MDQVTPFKQKIMAAAAFDDNRARFDMPRRYEHIDRPDLWSMAEEKAYRRLTPLLTRLVDEVEVLKAALEFYGDTKNYTPGGKLHDKHRVNHMDQGKVAREAITAHQKRWEDLK